VIDPDRRTLTLDGVTIRPVRRMFRLISFLARRPGVVFSREQIMDDIGISDRACYRSVDTTVKNARKLMREAGMPAKIRTQYGDGYFWADD
jgi:DNA-binding response OmpR family regulator